MDANKQKTAKDEQKVSTAGLNAFFRIADAWRLSDEEQMRLLGAIPPPTLRQWKNNVESTKLSKETLERISYVLGIYKALQILLPDVESADSWVRKPNTAPPFNGHTALETMLNDRAELILVRRYLDSQVKGW